MLSKPFFFSNLKFSPSDQFLFLILNFIPAMEPFPFLVPDPGKMDLPKPKRKYVKKNKVLPNGDQIDEAEPKRKYVKKNSEVPDSDEMEEVELKRKYVKKNRPTVEDDKVGVKEEGVLENQVGGEEVVVKPKRKYVKKIKVVVENQKIGADQVGEKDGDEGQGGVKPKRKYVKKNDLGVEKEKIRIEQKNVREDDAGEEAGDEPDVEKDKKSKKFADVLIYGLVGPLSITAPNY
jgi:hypothetical protein